MTEPVLVIHGVNTHEMAPFAAQVQQLQNVVGATRTLIPVHWGDLGGQSRDLPDCLPVYADGRWRVRAESGEMEAPLLASAQVRAFLGSADQGLGNETRAALVAGELAASAAVRAETAPAAEPVRETVASELANTQVLRHVDDAQLLALVGRTIDDVLREASAGTAPTGTYDVRGSDEDTRALLDPIRRIAGKVLHGIDDALGRFIGTQLGRVNQAVRERLANPAAATLGDVICYQGNEARIQQRLFDVIDQKAPGWGTRAQPISVVAHSLGGVVAFDAAVRPAVSGRQLHIRRLVTFGSQAAFFHIIDPRVPALEPYRHEAPVVLPAGSIMGWTNLWDPLDPLAFTAGTVFRLYGGTQPDDIPVQDSATELFETKLFPHSVYWASEELRRVLAQLG